LGLDKIGSCMLSVSDVQGLDGTFHTLGRN
jgi:hypothetical protein